MRSRLLTFQGKRRTQHFMSDSLCQVNSQKLMELQLLLKALFNVRSTRESTRDPGAEKASLAKFCKGRTHQLVFGCDVGVLSAVSPEDVKVSPLTPNMYFHLRRVRAHLCARIATQAPPFSRPPATYFMIACHQIHLPSCRLALLQAFSTEITAAFVAAGDTVAGWPSFSGADVGIA